MKCLALALALSGCHAPIESATPMPSPPKAIVRGETEASLAVFVAPLVRIYEQVDLVFDPERGMSARFKTASGDVEWSCDGSRALMVFRSAGCFVEKSCDAAVDYWLNLGWSYAELVRFVSGEVPTTPGWEIRHARMHDDLSRPPYKSSLQRTGVRFPGAVISWSGWRPSSLDLPTGPPQGFTPCPPPPPPPPQP